MTRGYHNNCKGHKYLVKINKCTVAYCTNSTTMFNVLLESNDTEKTSGPTQVNKPLLVINVKRLFDQTLHLH